MKNCKVCKEEKELTCFHKVKKGRLGVASVCKTCRAKTRKKYASKNNKVVLPIPPYKSNGKIPTSIETRIKEKIFRHPHWYEANKKKLALGSHPLSLGLGVKKCDTCKKILPSYSFKSLTRYVCKSCEWGVSKGKPNRPSIIKRMKKKDFNLEEQKKLYNSYGFLMDSSIDPDNPSEIHIWVLKKHGLYFCKETFRIIKDKKNE